MLYILGFFYKSGVDLPANYIYGQIFKKSHNWVSRTWKHILGWTSCAW